MDIYRASGSCYRIVDYSFRTFGLAPRKLFGQYLAIRKTDALLRKELDALTPETVSELGGHLSKKNNSLVVTYIHRIIEMKDSPAHVQRLLADLR